MYKISYILTQVTESTLVFWLIPVIFPAALRQR